MHSGAPVWRGPPGRVHLWPPEFPLDTCWGAVGTWGPALEEDCPVSRGHSSWLSCPGREALGEEATHPSHARPPPWPCPSGSMVGRPPWTRGGRRAPVVAAQGSRLVGRQLILKRCPPNSAWMNPGTRGSQRHLVKLHLFSGMLSTECVFWYSEILQCNEVEILEQF